MEAALAELQQTVATQAQQIARLTAVERGGGAAAGEAESRRLESIVDTKILNRIGVFSGNDED